MRLIGINGHRGSGKDTTYAMIRTLAANRGEEAVRRAFADKMKVLAALSLGYEGDDYALMKVINRLKDNGGVSTWIDGVEEQVIGGRDFVKNFGHNGRETFGDTFWIDLILPLGHHPTEGPPYPPRWYYTFCATPHQGCPEYAVVTDVRYPNEAQRVKDCGGEVWNLSKDSIGPDGHPSEEPLPPDLIDKWLTNNGTLTDLFVQVEEALC